MKRRLLRVLTSLGSMLCVAAVGLWIGSYVRPVAITHRTRTHVMSAIIDRGEITAERFESPLTEWEAVGWFHSSSESAPVPVSPSSPADPGTRLNLSFGGFRLFKSDGGRINVGDEMPVYMAFPPTVRLALPMWFVAIVLSLPAAIAAVRWSRRARRRTRRCCLVCGYDVRATPERCPECGTAAAV